MKILYILIGLKGRGKTHIGKLIQDKFNIPFVRVENIFKNIKGERHFNNKNYIKEGFTQLEKEIRANFEKYDKLTIESTGLTDEFKQMLENMRKDFTVRLIQIQADPELCIKRVLGRDNNDHINISDNDVRKINKMAMKEFYKFDLVIDNNSKAEEETLNVIRTLFTNE